MDQYLFYCIAWKSDNKDMISELENDHVFCDFLFFDR